MRATKDAMKGMKDGNDRSHDEFTRAHSPFGGGRDFPKDSSIESMDDPTGTKAQVDGEVMRPKGRPK